MNELEIKGTKKEQITWFMRPTEYVRIGDGTLLTNFEWCRREAERLKGNIVTDRMGQIAVYA